MNRISTTVLAAALVTGMAGVAFAPVAVAKKKEEPAPTGPQVSPVVGAAIQKAKTALLANDLVTAEAGIAEAETAAKTDDERYYATFLRYALVSQKISDAAKATNGVFDPRPMIGPIDALIANPKTPADMRPKFEYSRATIAYDQKTWPIAIDMFTRAIAHGSTELNAPLYLAKAKVQSGDAAGGMADMEKLFVSGKAQNEDFYKYAIAQSNQAGLKAETIKWLKRWVAAVPTAQTWRDALGFYALGQKPIAKLAKRESVDVFRLMRQTGSLADQYYYEEYAQKANDIGLPDETRAVIAEGKANGKIPSASTPAIQALLSGTAGQVTTPAAFAALERKADLDKTGALSSQTADAYLGAGQYAKAIPLYRQALTKGVANADEVNTHLGIALALSGDKAAAKTAFGAVTTAPRSEIAGFWSVWADNPPTK
jgi:tetratricopeptide (TPR) repeat protein